MGAWPRACVLIGQPSRSVPHLLVAVIVEYLIRQQVPTPEASQPRLPALPWRAASVIPAANVILCNARCQRREAVIPCALLLSLPRQRNAPQDSDHSGTLTRLRATAPRPAETSVLVASSGLQTPRAFPVPTAIGLISCAGLPCAAINLAPIFATRRPALVKSTHRKVQTTKPSMQSIPPVERTVEHGKREASTRVRIFRCHPTSTSHASGPSLT